MSATKIEWSDMSWSPLRARRKDTGKVGQHCERVSPGCAHCYAARHNGRNLPNGGTGLDYVRASRDLVETFVDERVLVQPLHWRKPRKVFVCNQTDIFADFYTDEQRDRVFAVMALASHHTFQVLTKRPERMRAYLADMQARCVALQEDERVRQAAYRCSCDDDDSKPQSWHDETARFEDGISAIAAMWDGKPLPNVWLGVSIENQATADERIPLLLETPAAVRFVSAEPLLEPINLRPFFWPVHGSWRAPHRSEREAETAGAIVEWKRQALVSAHARFVDWVIVGGESGPGARACDIAWIRSIVEQCKAAQVACFAKQLGAHVVCRNDQVSDWLDECGVALDDVETSDATFQGDLVRVHLFDKKGGDPAKWPNDLRVREFPRVREAVHS